MFKDCFRQVPQDCFRVFELKLNYEAYTKLPPFRNFTKTIEVFETVVKECAEFWAQQALASAAALQTPENKEEDAHSKTGSGVLNENKEPPGDINTKGSLPAANVEHGQDSAKSADNQTNVGDVKTTKVATDAD